MLSSQIEGTQSSLSDLLLFELDGAEGAPFDDVVDVSNYVAALELGIDRLRAGQPLSNRLPREVHGQVLAHVQFETIHPFLDGNGRVGRLLVALILFDAKVLSQPLLYLSLYLKENRAEYYRLLDAVRREGDWEAWIDFFLEGVVRTSQSAVETAHRLLALFADDGARVATLGRLAPNTLRVFELLRRRPIARIGTVVEATGMSFPAAARGIRALKELGVVREITGRKRERVYAYTRYLAILNEGAEPLVRIADAD